MTRIISGDRPPWVDAFGFDKALSRSIVGGEVSIAIAQKTVIRDVVTVRSRDRSGSVDAN